MSIGSFGASARAITLSEVAAGLCNIAIPRATLLQLQSYIHRERDRRASDAGVGGHGSTLVFIVAQFLALQAAGRQSASTIQRRIAELEESLGRRLVEPHGGGCRLTEELQSTPGCRRGLSLLPLRAPLVL